MSIIDYIHRPRRTRNKESLSSQTQRTIQALVITLALMIIALAAISFITTNVSAQKGYTLQQQKLRHEHLKSENEQVNAKVVNTKSLTEISAENGITHMQEATEKTYVTKEDNSVK